MDDERATPSVPAMTGGLAPSIPYYNAVPVHRGLAFNAYRWGLFA